MNRDDVELRVVSFPSLIPPPPRWLLFALEFEMAELVPDPAAIVTEFERRALFGD